MAISKDPPIPLLISLRLPSRSSLLVSLPLRTPPARFVHTLKAGPKSTITSIPTIIKPVPENDEIELLNERIRKRLRGRRLDDASTEPCLSAEESKTYIDMVKERQQRGLQKLRGEAQKLLGGFGYRVDPNALQPGDYVVHRKVQFCPNLCFVNYKCSVLR